MEQTDPLLLNQIGSLISQGTGMGMMDKALQEYVAKRLAALHLQWPVETAYQHSHAVVMQSHLTEAIQVRLAACLSIKH